MFSRAHLLIERDFERIKKEGNAHGITAYQVSNDSMFEWIVKLKGLKGSRWEDGVFRLYLKFTEHYNTRPPAVCFHTIPYHPNVDPITGKPCLEMLESNKWNKSISLFNILITIQTLLSNPEIEKAVNAQAAQLYRDRPALYNETVADCVVSSQRLDMGLDPYAIHAPIPVIEKRTENAGPPKSFVLSASRPPAVSDIISKVSFDDYHHTWSGMATSLSSQKDKNKYVDQVMEQPSLVDVHTGIGEEERQQRVKMQMMEHKTLYYGRMKENDNIDWKDTRMADLEKMKKLYLPERRSASKTPRQGSEGLDNTGIVPANTPRHTAMEQHWEQEVDELVAWTSNLDDSHL